MRVLFLVFVWGPALLGYSLGWLARHPHDWTGPAAIAPVGAVLTALTYRWGVRRFRGSDDVGFRDAFRAAMVAAASVGVAIFVMLVGGVIG
jgi:hypothetical protein